MCKANDELLQGQTYLIAPSDYVHIYGKDMHKNKKDSSGSKSKNASSRKTSQDSRKSSNRRSAKSRTSKQDKKKATNDQISDMPTAMIAPADYVAIYHKDDSASSCKTERKQEKSKDSQEQQGSSPEAAPGDDMPTAMIAPNDYIHIFKGPWLSD